MEQIVSATEARTHFGEMMRRVIENEETIIVERAGKREIVLLSLAQYEEMKQSQATKQALFWETLTALHLQIQARVGDTVSWLNPEELLRQSREERDEQLRNSLH